MRDSLIGSIRNSALYDKVRSLYHRLRPNNRHPLQDFEPATSHKLRRLGTEYGGWTFVDDESLFRSTIISAGLGEDASFDVEFARAYEARVIIVDPTPRAQLHFAEIVARLGEPRRCGYSVGGKQPAEAYDLRGVDRSNLVLVPKALWTNAERLKFFAPAKSAHVSHSILNYQRDYSDEGPYIEVDAISLVDLVADLEIPCRDQLELVKLDIEGAEVEVISHFLDCGFRPRQILVEFDELNVPSPKSHLRIDLVTEKLDRCGYECIWSDRQANFLYLRKNA